MSMARPKGLIRRNPRGGCTDRSGAVTRAGAVAVTTAAALLSLAGATSANVLPVPKVLRVFTAGSSGSAFVLGPTEKGGCVLLTARHVIDSSVGAEPIEVRSQSGRILRFVNASFRKSAKLDLAYLPTSDCSLSLGIPLARPRGIGVGLKVAILGYPLSDESVNGRIPPTAVAAGRITQYNDTEGYDLNYDAPTAVGYSGGPIIDRGSGSLLGLHGQSDNVLDSADNSKVGGRGISAPLIHRELRAIGLTLRRSESAPCFTGSCN